MPDTKNESEQFAVKDGKLEVTNTVQEVKVIAFDYKALVDQQGRIQAQKDADNIQRDLELAKINARIQAAKDGNLDKP